jgi:hypothetical protein
MPLTPASPEPGDQPAMPATDKVTTQVTELLARLVRERGWRKLFETVRNCWKLFETV